MPTPLRSRGPSRHAQVSFMERAGTLHRSAGQAGRAETLSMLSLSTPQFCARLGVGVQEYEAYATGWQNGEPSQSSRQ